MNADSNPSPIYPDAKEETVLQIVRVADLLIRIGNTRVFGRELTQAQFNVLMVLKRRGKDGMSQKEILESLVSSKGNVSIHIANLTRMGYIRKKVSKTDSRMHEITLTAKGRNILDELEPRYMKSLRELTGDLSPAQVRTTLQLLYDLQQRCETALNAADDGKEGGDVS